MPVASKMVSSMAIQSGFEDTPYEGDISVNYITCVFDSEGISKAFEFYIMPNVVLSSSVRSAKSAKEKYPEKIVPFFMPPPISSLHPSAVDVADTIRSNKGLFNGIGELAIYHYPSNIQPDGPYFLELYRIANEQYLIVMMHPGTNHKAAVEKVVNENPKVNFLIHGDQDKAWILELMSKFPNVYYSLDVDMTSIYGFEPKHEFKKPTKEEWLAYFRQNFDSIVNKAVGKWKTAIETNPDRFMWGTDRWYSWHFEYETGGLLAEFGRSFIGQLDPAVQEKFAYKNVERLLQER